MRRKPPAEKPYSAAVRAAIAVQKAMAASFRDSPFPPPPGPRFLGGADIAFAKAPDGTRTGSVGAPAIGIAIVYDLVEQRLIDASYVRTIVDFPYVPGLLSFRVASFLPAAFAALKTPLHQIDAWLFDGQGRAHPRGVGLATHMGILLDVPSIGAAKSLLIGRYVTPARLARFLAARDSAPPRLPLTAPVLHKEVHVAHALWTLPRTEPMIISQGHRCTLDQALATARAATLPGRWMPEPTRLADELTKLTRDLPEAAGRAHVRARIPAKKAVAD
jgi:deoxyribonuclease V